MSDRILAMHTMACDWPGCKAVAYDDLADSMPTYEDAVGRWGYLPGQPVDDWKEDSWMHDPESGHDYCSDHWHYEGDIRVLGPAAHHE